MQVHRRELERVVGDERRPAAGQFVGDAPQAVEVGGRSARTGPLEQLRRGVSVIVGQSLHRGSQGRDREHRIAEHDATVTRQEDVGWLDTAMDHSR